MEVVVYTRPGDKDSLRVKELLEDQRVSFEEHVYAGGRLNGRDLKGLGIELGDLPLTVVDGVPIKGMDRARIEQAIGWIGF